MSIFLKSLIRQTIQLFMTQSNWQWETPCLIHHNCPTTILPLVAPGQISEKKNNQIFRVSKALELFIEDNSELENKYKLFAQRRLTARAWRFAKRHKDSSFFTKWFLLYLKGFFYLNSNILENCRKANEIYNEFLD